MSIERIDSYFDLKRTELAKLIVALGIVAQPTVANADLPLTTPTTIDDQDALAPNYTNWSSFNGCHISHDFSSFPFEISLFCTDNYPDPQFYTYEGNQFAILSAIDFQGPAQFQLIDIGNGGLTVYYSPEPTSEFAPNNSSISYAMGETENYIYLLEQFTTIGTFTVIIADKQNPRESMSAYHQNHIVLNKPFGAANAAVTALTGYTDLEGNEYFVVALSDFGGNFLPYLAFYRIDPDMDANINIAEPQIVSLDLTLIQSAMDREGRTQILDLKSDFADQIKLALYDFAEAESMVLIANLANEPIPEPEPDVGVADTDVEMDSSVDSETPDTILDTSDFDTEMEDSTQDSAVLDPDSSEPDSVLFDTNTPDVAPDMPPVQTDTSKPEPDLPPASAAANSGCATAPRRPENFPGNLALLVALVAAALRRLR